MHIAQTLQQNERPFMMLAFCYNEKSSLVLARDANVISDSWSMRLDEQTDLTRFF